MYSVETDIDGIADLEALPLDGLTAYAEVVSLLQVAPLGGALLNPSKPTSNMRSVTFGPDGQGLVVYFVLEDQRRVVVLIVRWLGRIRD